jgi:hypothetical protein
METKRFTITPIDLIKSGTFAYSYDANKELLHYDLHAVVQKWFVTKNIDQSGSQPMARTDMQSSLYTKIGQKINFANLSGMVTEIKNHIATVKLNVVGLDAHGIATFNLAGPTIELLHLDAEGSAYGFNFRIVLVPERPSKRGG